MSDHSRREELARAFRAVCPYLLSHHEPAAWNRCHRVTVPLSGRTVRLCARCSGIYPGIAVGALAAAVGWLPTAPLLVAVLPAFALGEWAITSFRERAGSNLVRTATGVLLGIGYGLGLVALTRPATRLSVLLVGAGYAVLAGALLGWYFREVDESESR